MSGPVRYDWKAVRSSVSVNMDYSGEFMWRHKFEAMGARMKDESATWLGDPPVHYPAHVRNCPLCQQNWAREIMREHVEAVLLRVMER